MSDIERIVARLSEAQPMRSRTFYSIAEVLRYRQAVRDRLKETEQ